MMKPTLTHPWQLSEADAIALQHDLAKNVDTTDQLPKNIRYLAGVDVAYAQASDQLVAAVVILEADTLNVVDTVTVIDQAHFPYIPGLFSFREVPPLIKAFSKLKYTPDLLICDGHGLAHPRRFGLACHLGLIFEVPSIGCGKTKFIGDFQEPGLQRGESAHLIDQQNIIGNVVRTQTGIKPVFVSIGHRISLSTACQWILKLTPNYRLPETTRQADQVVNRSLKTLKDAVK